MTPPSRRPKDRWHDSFGGVATRCAQVLLVLAVVVIVAYLGVTLKLVVVPVLIAVLIAAAASPLVSLLARRLPRSLAAGITMLLGIVVLGGVGFLVANAVADQWGQLREGAVEGFQQLTDLVESGPFGLPATDMDEIVSQLEGALQGSAVQSGALTGAAAVAQIATGVLLAVVVLFFLLKDGRVIWTFFRDQLPEREHHRFDLVGTRSAAVMGGYVRGTAAVASVDAVLIGIGLTIVGVPLALPLALLTFVAAFVPVIGAVAAGVVAVLIALVSNGPVDALIVLVIVIVVQQLEGNVLQPILMGHTLSLHPLVILLALTAGSIVAGVIGAVLAVPFAAVAWAAVQASRQAHRDEEEWEAERVRHAEPAVVAADAASAAADAASSAAAAAAASADDGQRPAPRGGSVRSSAYQEPGLRERATSVVKGLGRRRKG
ncbi:AI-2E family transporter [Aquipuribacter hungaricus]|uniref:AI-2E family transporter n=1 Tax=Aquipuribacter hungaricus TaxID=545624 RepID=A0ABV7WJQ4_9MICO